MNLKTMYDRAYTINRGMQRLFKSFHIPTDNYCVFADFLIDNTPKLYQNKEWLILLAALFNPISHLLESRTPFFEECLKSPVAIKQMEAFKALFPQKFDAVINAFIALEIFSITYNDSSLTLPLRLQEFTKALEKQHEYMQALEQFLGNYQDNKKTAKDQWRQKQVNDETKAGGEEYEKTDREELKADSQTFMILKIFLEYVQNLQVEDKNRSKYRQIRENVSNCVNLYEKFIIDTVNAADDTDTDMDDDITSDIIWANFKRILFMATHEPYQEIGPAYIYWIFSKRIFKLGEPKTTDVDKPYQVSFLLGNERDFFPLNKKTHMQNATITDQANVHLFNSLCQFWEREELGEVGFSKFLLFRTMPIYADFLTFNPNPLRESRNKDIQHKYCNYHIAEFTNSLFVRLFASVSDSLFQSVKKWNFKQNISSAAVKNYFDSDETEKMPLDFDAYVPREIQVFDDSIQPLSKFDRARILRVVLNFAKRKENISQFKKIYITDAVERAEAEFSVDEYEEVFSEYQEEVCSIIDDELTQKIQRLNKITELEKEDFWDNLNDFVFDAICIACMKAVYRSYWEKIGQYFKTCLYEQDYEEAQYQTLKKFIKRE